MSLTRADFDNAAVHNAANPSPFGYHHGAQRLTRCCAYAEDTLGPIPHNNPTYVDPVRAQAIRDGVRRTLRMSSICNADANLRSSA